VARGTSLSRYFQTTQSHAIRPADREPGRGRPRKIPQNSAVGRTPRAEYTGFVGFRRHRDATVFGDHVAEGSYRDTVKSGCLEWRSLFKIYKHGGPDRYGVLEFQITLNYKKRGDNGRQAHRFTRGSALLKRSTEKGA
jgi:hypothetical protein